MFYFAKVTYKSDKLSQENFFESHFWKWLWKSMWMRTIWKVQLLKV